MGEGDREREREGVDDPAVATRGDAEALRRADAGDDEDAVREAAKENDAPGEEMGALDPESAEEPGGATALEGDAVAAGMEAEGKATADADAGAVEATALEAEGVGKPVLGIEGDRVGVPKPVPELDEDLEAVLDPDADMEAVSAADPDEKHVPELDLESETVGSTEVVAAADAEGVDDAVPVREGVAEDVPETDTDGAILLVMEDVETIEAPADLVRLREAS